MKIAKKQKKIPLKIILIIVVLLGIGGFAALSLYQSQRANNIASSDQQAVRPINDVDYSAPTTDEQKEQNDRKDEIIKQSENQLPADGSITVSISRATQGAKGQPLNIRTVITGTTRGTCHVELTRAGQSTVTKSFPITVQATSSTCEQADIPAADFSTDGEWSLSITAKNDTQTSNKATGSVTISR